MQSIVPFIIAGLIGGVAVGLQPPLASLMSHRLGLMESLFIIHIGGAVMVAVPLLVMGGGNLGAWRSVPWYALGAGVFGLVVLGAVSFTIPRLGVTVTAILIVSGQLVIGALLDHFGLLGASVRPMGPARMMGILVLFLGIWLVVR